MDPAIPGSSTQPFYSPIADNSDNDNVDSSCPLHQGWVLVYENYDDYGKLIVCLGDLDIHTAASVSNAQWSKHIEARSPVTDGFKQDLSSQILIGSRFGRPFLNCIPNVKFLREKVFQFFG